MIHNMNMSIHCDVIGTLPFFGKKGTLDNGIVADL